MTKLELAACNFIVAYDTWIWLEEQVFQHDAPEDLEDRLNRAYDAYKAAIVALRASAEDAG